LITDIHLSSNLSLFGTPGSGENPRGSIIETVTAHDTGQVANITNFVRPDSSQLQSGSTFTPPGPYMTLDVTKDVILFSTPGTDVVVSFIDQSFSQVPEPGSVVLLGMGGLGLVGAAWRRRRANAG